MRIDQHVIARPLNRHTLPCSDTNRAKFTEHMLRVLLFIISMLSSVVGMSVLAGPGSDKIAQRAPEPFPGYAKACGYPILFQNISTISLARIDARLGPVIVLDPLLTYPAQTAHRRFMIAHECAHHRFGHATPKGLRARAVNKGVEDQELSADCWAAEALTRAGLYNDVRFVVDLFYRKGLHSPGSGYPSGIQRSTIIYHCLKTAHRESAPTKSSRDE